MLFSAANLAIKQLLSRKFRGVMWKSLGWTIALFTGTWFGLEALASAFLLPQLANWPLLATAINWLLGVGVFIGAMFLIAPVSAIFAGFFLDEIAEEVERVYYPNDPPGQTLPLVSALFITVKFTALVIFGNLLALILLLVPGINVLVFFVLNGFLLGREYYQFASLRYLPEKQAKLLRQRHGSSVFIAGLMIAFTLTIPIINLFAPLFAAAVMVHLSKKMIMKSDAYGMNDDHGQGG